MSTALQEVVPADVLALEQRLAGYLPPEQIARVRQAYFTGAHAHAGQTRKSGEPYITHPVAVASILADLRMDAETIIAAILHDTLEDTPLPRAEIEAKFGATVAELVDGVTKLDRVKFSSLQEAAAESFRKMLLAMARDLRVILIKLADRLHNMRTLGSMALGSRRRIARETLDIYGPIAQRLGMNRIKSELQDLGFRVLYPTRHRGDRGAHQERARQPARGHDQDRGGAIRAARGRGRQASASSAGSRRHTASTTRCTRNTKPSPRSWTSTVCASSSTRPCSAITRSARFTVCTSRWMRVSATSSRFRKPMVISRCTPCCSVRSARRLKSRYAPTTWTRLPNAAWPRTGSTRPRVSRRTRRSRARATGSRVLSRPRCAKLHLPPNSSKM